MRIKEIVFRSMSYLGNIKELPIGIPISVYEGGKLAKYQSQLPQEAALVKSANLPTEWSVIDSGVSVIGQKERNIIANIFEIRSINRNSGVFFRARYSAQLSKFEFMRISYDEFDFDMKASNLQSVTMADFAKLIDSSFKDTLSFVRDHAKLTTLQKQAVNKYIASS